MKNGQGQGAVLYIRVSTDEQANGPLNLHNQEKNCRDYCRKNGLQVIEVFIDPGFSARSADRPEFQRMLQYCNTHRKKVEYIVVQDLSRFARNLRDQAQAIADLRSMGVLLRSTYEPNIDDTAAGRFAANLLGSFHQFFSDALSEKMKDRTRQAVTAGRFPWNAPVGYSNIGGNSGPNIKPDPDRAPHVRRTFELMATGKYRKTEVLKIVTDEGLLSRKGKRLQPQTFQQVLKNPLYAGWVSLPSEPDFAPVRGLHEPIVSQELFDRVQDVLNGRQVTPVPKRAYNPKLPLKHLVKCASCETPLTGAECGGRAKKYRHYWCRKPGCRAVKLRAEKLEAEFVAVLGRLHPDPDSLARFPKIAAKVWAEQQGDIEKQTKKQSAKLNELKQLRIALRTKLLEGVLSDEEYKESRDDFDAKIAVVEQELQLLNSSRGELDRFVRFAELLLMDIAHAWEIAGPEQRQRVQNLLFHDGLHYSPQDGILNRSNSSLFTVLEGMTDENRLLASPAGFEPALSP